MKYSFMVYTYYKQLSAHHLKERRKWF